MRITTLKQDILYTGFEHIHSDLILRCWLIRQFGQMDGRARKIVLFSEKDLLVRMGPSWTGISFLWTHFFRLSDAIRTALSHKKVNLKEKKTFACFHCVDKLCKEMVSPNLSNERACPQLSVETHPHACNNESKGRQKSKQGRSKPWHQAQNREHPRTIARAISCTFNHPKSRQQLEQSVVNRRCGTVI